MNGMDRQLRDLLEAAAGEPPHRVTAEAVRRRVVRRRVVEFAAAAVALAAIAALIPVGIGALGRGPGPSTNVPAAARIFTSRHYGYTEALPAGWRLARQATRQWSGKGGPGYDRPVVDLFAGPRGVRPGRTRHQRRSVWQSYTSAIIQAARAAHPCSPPLTDQALRIGGAPARLVGMHCPASGSFLVEIAVTVRNGTGFVFVSQNQRRGPPGPTSLPPPSANSWLASGFNRKGSPRTTPPARR